MRCLECNTYLAAGSLKAHRKKMHGFIGTIPNSAAARPRTEAQTYQVLFTQTETTIHSLVEGYKGRAANCTNLRINLSHHHMWYTIIIL